MWKLDLTWKSTTPFVKCELLKELDNEKFEICTSDNFHILIIIFIHFVYTKPQRLNIILWHVFLNNGYNDFINMTVSILHGKIVVYFSFEFHKSSFKTNFNSPSANIFWIRCDEYARFSWVFFALIVLSKVQLKTLFKIENLNLSMN